MKEIKGTLPSGRFNAGFKAGSSSDPNRPLMGAELLVMELADEEDIDERVRVALTGDISKDLGFELNDVNKVVELLRADGGLVTVTIEKGLITRVRFGDGTESDPYQVWNAEDLDDVRNGLDKHYLQMADIDLSGLAWLPIGSRVSHFSGVYDGNGYAVDNLNVVNAPGYDVGLFCVISAATIKNLDVSGIAEGGRYVSAGLLAGQAINGSVIENAGARGQVSAFDKIGVLVGLAHNCTVSRCQAEGAAVGLAAASIVGGLIGALQEGDLEDCSANVSVGGSGSDVGGLVGYIRGLPFPGAVVEILRNCYACGAVDDEAADDASGLANVIDVHGWSVESCYWDKDTSGQDTSDIGTGKTTAEMKMEATYVGWDFVNIWSIAEGVGYPQLRRL